MGAGDENKQPLRYLWRKALLERGPTDANTRLVCLALNHHMDDDGYCFPGINLLAMETCLNERTVRKYLKKACDSGWLKRQSRRSRGKGWRHYEYWALVPDSQGPGTAPAPTGHHAGSEAEGAGVEYQMARAEHPLNLSKNYSKNFSEEHLKKMKDILKTVPLIRR